MTDRSVSCHACGREFAYEGALSRGAVCEGCGEELRCCLNCRFFDQSSYNECSEPSAERVVDKSKSNFCDYFTPAAASAATRGGEAVGSLDDLDALFKK